MLSSSRARWFAFAALLGAAALSASGTQAADAADSVPPKGDLTAVWQMRQIDFAYESPNISYECEALQKRITQILQGVGAYSKMVVETRDCRRKEQVRRTDISLTLAIPVEATDENVRTAAEFNALEEIVARIREEPLPAADVKRFPAAWRRVTLSNSAPAKLTAGDCDLVRVLRDQVFPRINVRVVGSGMNCGAGPDTRIQPKMRVHALMPTRT